MKKQQVSLELEARWWSIISNFKNIVYYNKIYNVNKLFGRKIYHLKMQNFVNDKIECDKLFKICEKNNFSTIQVKEICCGRIGECLGRIIIELDEAIENRKKGIWDVFIWLGRPSNQTLLSMIERYNAVITPQNLGIWMLFLEKTNKKLIFQKRKAYRISSKHFERIIGDPFIEFSNEEKIFGEQKLIKMGIQSEYVCIFSRDSAYLENITPKTAFSFYKYRDSDIECFLSTINSLKMKNILAVRVGRITEKKIDVDNCIDFSNKFYSEFMDLYLMYRCKFFIGDCAGINFMPAIFARPLAITNVAWAFGPVWGGVAKQQG